MKASREKKKKIWHLISPVFVPPVAKKSLVSAAVAEWLGELPCNWRVDGSMLHSINPDITTWAKKPLS